MTPETSPSLFSVVICTYNRCESLRATLRSLAEQSLAHGVHLEIVIVDNNSRDHTKAIVDEAAQQTSWPVRYIFEPKQGLSCARNSGIRAAHGEILAFIDDDVVVEPQWVQALWECFQQTGCDAIAGRVRARWVCPRPAWLLDELHGPLISQELGSQRMRWTFANRFMLGANMAFRRNVFQTVGKFKEELGRRGSALIGGEDRDICERLLAAGLVLFYEPQAVVWHTIEPQRVTPQYYRRWYQDIAYTQAHQFDGKWHHAWSIAPLWRWQALCAAWARYVRARLFASNEATRLQTECWWIYERSFLRERLAHWRKQFPCHFVKA